MADGEYGYPGEPETPEDIEREFPGVKVRQGTELYWHADAEDGMSYHGESLTDLRDQLIAARWLRRFTLEKSNLGE